MKKILTSIFLAGVICVPVVANASAASAAPVKSDRKAVVIDARKAEKERILLEKER